MSLSHQKQTVKFQAVAWLFVLSRHSDPVLPRASYPRSPSRSTLPSTSPPSTSFIMGKVHGSLARAGKVKSQTPKVEKQEKTKTPKGRALKRLKYTRRFVNVTLTGGKRKMNPNPGS
ncbi:hypothetical protein FOVSG1_008659 [Fusarium oxysporum f. sp. vasinfectum]